MNNTKSKVTGLNALDSSIDKLTQLGAEMKRFDEYFHKAEIMTSSQIDIVRRNGFARMCRAARTNKLKDLISKLVFEKQMDRIRAKGC